MIDFCGFCYCCLFPCLILVFFCHSNRCVVSKLFLSEYLTWGEYVPDTEDTVIYWRQLASRLHVSLLNSALLCHICSLELAMKLQKQTQVREAVLLFVLFCFVGFFSPCNQLPNTHQHPTGHCLYQACVLEKYSECNKSENQCLPENTRNTLYYSVLEV